MTRSKEASSRVFRIDGEKIGVEDDIHRALAKDGAVAMIRTNANRLGEIECIEDPDDGPSADSIHGENAIHLQEFTRVVVRIGNGFLFTGEFQGLTELRSRGKPIVHALRFALDNGEVIHTNRSRTEILSIIELSNSQDKG